MLSVCVFVLCVLPRVPDSDKKVSVFFFLDDGLKKSVDTKVISVQCAECHKNVNSNKRGCGSLVKAQARARVDVPTARVFSCVDQGVQHECKFLLRMLGYVFSGNRP